MALLVDALQTTLTATSDNSGNVTFLFPGPAGSDSGFRGTFACINAGAGAKFVAQVAAGPQWGPWFGPQPGTPVTYQANLQTKIIGSGLRPNTTLTLEVIGYIDDINSLLASHPLPTGTTFLVGNDLVQSFGGPTILNLTPGQVTTIPTQQQGGGFYPAGGYSALRVSAVNPSTQAAVGVAIDWYDATGVFHLGHREFLIGPGGTATKEGATLETVLVHMGDVFAVTLSNHHASQTAQITLAIENTTQPFQAWGGVDLPSTIVSGQAVGAGATVTLTNPPYVFGGPGVLFQQSPGGAFSFNTLDVMTNTGAWVSLLTFPSSSGPVALAIPAQPVRIVGHNTGTVAAPNYGAALTYDLSRVG